MGNRRLTSTIALVAALLLLLAYSPGTALTAGAPAVEWVRQFGTTANDGAIAVVVDGQGNVYVGGSTAGMLVAGSPGGTDAFLRKYSPAGAELWTRQFGLAGYDGAEAIGVDGAGNVYVIGRTRVTVPGPQIDAFIYKFNSSGSQLWYQQFGTTSDEYVMGGAVDGAGNVYVTGSTFGTFPIPGYTRAGNERETFVVKYTTDGGQVWARQFGLLGAAVDANAVVVDNSGNVYVVGETGGNLVGPPPGIGGGDAFITKYNSSGAPQWTRQFGTAAEDNARSVVADAAGNILVTGFTRGTFPGEVSQGGADIYIRKYNGAGADLWTRQSGTALDDYPLGIAVDSAGRIYVAGSRWTSGPFVSVDAFVRGYDDVGGHLWEHMMATTYVDQAYRVAAPGPVYVAGYTGGILGPASSGGEDAFLVKLSGIPVTPTPEPSQSPSPAVTPAPTPTPGPTLTPTPSALLGDINLDGAVNILDLTLMAGSFNKKSGQVGFLPAADINGDGIVDIFDLVIVGRNFGG